MNMCVRKYINNCEVCLKSKYERNPIKNINKTETPKNPFEIINLDSFEIERKKFITMIDQFSKYAEAHPVKSISAKEIIKVLEKILNRNPYPSKIVTDAGREFNNESFREFCKANKIKTHFTSIQNPNSNSPIERLHSTLLEHLQIIKLDPNHKNKNITEKMQLATTAYNNTIHSTTGLTPLNIHFGKTDKITDPKNTPRVKLIENHIKNKEMVNKLIRNKIESNKKRMGEANPEKLPKEIYLKKRKISIKGTQNYSKLNVKSYDKTLGKFIDSKENKYRISRIKSPRMFQENT